MDSPLPDGLRYEFGNEHSPTNPWGRVVFTLAGDGAARLENHRRGQPFRVWTALVTQDAMVLVAARLVASGFPQAPRVVPPAGSALRLLSVPGTTATVMLPWHEARRLSGYGALFSALDSLISQINGSAIELPDELPPSVRDIHEEPT